MFMRKIVVQVDKNNNFDTCMQIKIAQLLCKNWRLSDESTIQIQFGNRIEAVTVKVAPSLKVPTIEIPPMLAEKLSIPFEILPIHCLYKKDQNTLTLGPIITCITNQAFQEDSKFGGMTPFFEELAYLAQHIHILFYVQPLIKWNEQFSGYSFHQKQWKNHLFPEPNAIYNRIGSRLFETSKVYQQFTHFLDKKDIPYFNHSFLDKWDLHQAMSSFPEIIPYLPDTTLFNDYENFTQKLNLYDCIFLKPVRGSQGKQILKIKKADNGYIVYYSSFSQEISSYFTSSYQLYKRLTERLNKKRYIIQQGINLVQFEKERPTDFRILCIKKDNNQWNVISSVARISSKEKMVSNLAQGGEQKKSIDVLTTIYCEKLAKQYVKLMGELALEVANLISESFEGLFGELGIDIALDKEGKLWIIEVNSKPSKLESDEASDRIRPSTKALLTYLAFLSGFPLLTSEKGKKER